MRRTTVQSRKSLYKYQAETAVSIPSPFGESFGGQEVGVLLDYDELQLQWMVSVLWELRFGFCSFLLIAFWLDMFLGG